MLATIALQLFLPRSVLDEDNETFIQADEIRAKVTLTPIPTSRESNLVRLGGIGPVEGWQTAGSASAPAGA